MGPIEAICKECDCPVYVCTSCKEDDPHVTAVNTCKVGAALAEHPKLARGIVKRMASDEKFAAYLAAVALLGKDGDALKKLVQTIDVDAPIPDIDPNDPVVVPDKPSKKKK